MISRIGVARPTSAPTFLEHWPVALPRHQGPWTVRSGECRWGVLDPERRTVRPVDPVHDPALPALEEVLRRGTLIGYRVGRRAIVATPNSFVKVVRPKRLDALLAAHTRLPHSTTMVPQVIASDASGWVEFSAVPGPSFHEILRRPFGGDEIPTVINDIAQALATFHLSPPPAGLPIRAIDSPQRWIETVGRVEPDAVAPLSRVARELPELEASPRCQVHGDLHDKNVFASRLGVGLIDFDNTGLGMPEDDVANLAVHLQLRSLQARQPAEIGEARADLLYSVYRNQQLLDTDRLEAVERHTWFRLACLYRFRRSSRHLTFELLRRSTPLRARAMAAS